MNYTAPAKAAGQNGDKAVTSIGKRDLDVALDLGGMPAGAQTKIPGTWLVPAEVTVDEGLGLLLWRGPLRPRPSTTWLLRDFLSIWSAKDFARAVGRFAEQWGPLRLCQEHKRPVTHRRDNAGDVVRTLTRNETPSYCVERQLGDGWFAEPLEVWHKLSRQAFLIIKAGSLANRDELPFATHNQLLADILGLPKSTPSAEIFWRYLQRLQLTEETWASMGWFAPLIELGEMPDVAERFANTMVGRVRDLIGTETQFAKTLRHPNAIAERVNAWIEDGGGCKRKAVWQDSKLEWREEVSSLYAAIGVGLGNVIGDMTIHPRCRHCGRVFEPRTRTQAYCMLPKCRQVRNTERQRRHRAKRAVQAS
jgi:hypothetical protein